MDECCLFCGATRKQLMLCGRCRGAAYCSEKCQREHWRLHKPWCRPRSDKEQLQLVHLRRQITTGRLATNLGMLRDYAVLSGLAGETNCFSVQPLENVAGHEVGMKMRNGFGLPVGAGLYVVMTDQDVTLTQRQFSLER